LSMLIMNHPVALCSLSCALIRTFALFLFLRSAFSVPAVDCITRRERLNCPFSGSPEAYWLMTGESRFPSFFNHLLAGLVLCAIAFMSGAAMAQDDRPVVLVFGDSLSAGYRMNIE